MNKAQSLLIFFFIPALIISLTVVNAQVLAQKYLGQELGLAQYNVIIVIDNTYVCVSVGQRFQVVATVSNEGMTTWLSRTEKGIFLSCRIKDQFSDRYISEGDRIPFPEALKPGESIVLAMEIKAPLEIGKYYVKIDVVHESVSWLEDVGSAVAILELDVNE